VTSADIISSGLLELYAAGLATPEEAGQVVQWKLQYPEVAAELDAIESSLENYARAQAVQPAPAVKQQLMQKLGATVQPVADTVSTPNAPAKIIGLPAYWRTTAAAALLLLLGSVVLNYLQYQKNNATTAQLAETQQSLATTEAANRSLSQDMDVVQSRYSTPISLKGLEAAPEANAKIFWMQNTGEVFIDASNLPTAPANKQYELWAFVDGKPVNAGIILSSKTGNNYRIQKMKAFGKVEAFAVSLEDKKATPATSPLGPVYVMGKM
jgi:anti-sigma-K factor RskA